MMTPIHDKHGLTLYCGDVLATLAELPAESVDLVFGSPPYEKARSYDIGFNLVGQDWVDWMVEQMVEMLRVCRGLVVMVVEGQTKGFRWSATPALLMADLHRKGVHLRKPPVFHRAGIPGSGGPDWWRNDYEFIVCCTSGGKLPWSDNTATGHPPKYQTGGACSNRTQGGRRANEHHGKTPSETQRRNGAKGNAGYAKPTIANPGNVISAQVGGGHMGHALAHENEAPFPEKLVEPFVRCFCPPDGVVLDPFCGSGTTLAVAKQFGRRGIGIDIRKSQIELSWRRMTAPLGKTERQVESLPGQKELF